MSSLYRSVIARARARALATRLSENYESAAPTYNAGAVGSGRVRIGNQIYAATTTQTSGAVAVKNAGRPGAAIYAPTIASGATVTRGSGSSTGSTVATYHNQLLGLTTGDDHTQYLNTYRGDARYVLNERMIIAWAPLVTTPTDGRLDSDVQISLDLADDSGLLGDATGLRLGTPGTLSVSSAAAVTTSSHTHPITASSAPGAAAALLKSGADGRLTLVGLAATSEISAPKVQTASGDLWLAPASGKAGIGTATPAEALDVAGKVRAQTALQTPQIETASGNLAIAPAGTLAILASGKGVRSYSFASGFTGNGWQIDDGITVTGRTTAEVDDLTVRGRMRIYELLIHQIRATNGSIFVSSTGKAKTVTAAGGASYTIVTETDHGFLTGDIIRAQRFTGTGIYQCDMTVTAVGSTTQFTATLRTGYDTPAINMEFVRLGNISDTSRQGAIYMTADDSGAPYLDVVDGIALYTDWNTAGKIKTRLGKLTGITGTANEYGLAAGNGFTATDPHVIISSDRTEIHNIPIRAYSGATQTAEISSAGRLRVGTNISNANTTLLDANPTAGTLTIGNASAPASVDLYGRLRVPVSGANITGSPATGLNVTGTALGYYDGSAWKSYIDSSGNFYFAGNSGARLEYNASAGKLRGINGSSVEQWYASGADGKLYAGAGKTVLDASGLSLYYEAGWTTAPDQSKIGWFTTPSTRTGETFSLLVGDDQSVYAPEVPAASRGHGLYLVSTNTILPTIFVKSTSDGPHAVVTEATRPYSTSGNRWGVWPQIDTSGVMEIGAYLDFHESDADTSDYGARLYSASGTLYASGGIAAGGGISGTGAITATGSTAKLATAIRDDTGKQFAWYATGGSFRAHHSVNGDLLRITDAGRLMVGNTTDLYAAKIQTNGGIAASSWINTDAYLQVKGGTEPTSHVDYFQIYMTQDVPAEGKRTVWVKCRNTTNTGDYSAVLARNYTP